MANEEYTMILFPEYVAAKKAVERLQTEVSMLLLERDELRFVQCKNIETAYMLALGDIEYKAYELNCSVLRLKRKLELVQAKKNRQEPVDITAIEKSLDGEFEEYKKKLDAQIDKINAAIERNRGEYLSEEENKELKKLYRGIMKALHPDLNLDVTEAQIRLFENAVQAYEDGDLDTMRIIGAMVAAPVLTEQSEDALSVLMKEKKRLSEIVETIRSQIAKIKAEYPYNLKELVEDPEKIEAKRVEFEQLIEELAGVYESYDARLKELLRQV